MYIEDDLVREDGHGFTDVVWDEDINPELRNVDVSAVSSPQTRQGSLCWDNTDVFFLRKPVLSSTSRVRSLLKTANLFDSPLGVTNLSPM